MNRTFITGSISLSFLLFSCLVYKKAETLKSNEGYITALPLQPHKNDVEIFLNEQPTKPYYKVKFVEITSSPATTGEAFLAMLRSEAQKQGLDAVIVEDIGKQLSNINTVESFNGIVSFIKLTGIGIKYKDQLSYITSILKEQEVHLWLNESEPPKIFLMQFDMFGQPLSLSDSLVNWFFNREVYPYETHQSVYGPIPQWQFRLDTINGMFTKRFTENVWIELKSQFAFKGDKIQSGTVTEYTAFEKIKAKYNLEFQYNEKGVLVKRILRNRANKVILWQDEFTYYLSGRLMKTVRSIRNNGRTQPYFEISNTYFTETDLPPAKN
jgi:hypothetical protein